MSKDSGFLQPLGLPLTLTLETPTDSDCDSRLQRCSEDGSLMVPDSATCCFRTCPGLPCQGGRKAPDAISAAI